MKKDLAGALILTGIFVFMLATRTKAPEVLRQMSGSRSVSSIIILGLVAYAYEKGYHSTAFIGALFSVYLLKMFWVTWPSSYEHEVHLHIAQDRARFDPSTSVDLQFANKSLTHNLPVLLVKPVFLDMLEFPPSTETLTEMSG